MPSERVECMRMNRVSQEESSNSWSTCKERVGTENKVSVGDCERLEEKDNLRT